jgi:hypothetical protein
MLLSIQQSCNRWGVRWRWNRLVALALVTSVLGVGGVSAVEAQSKDGKPADPVPAETPTQVPGENSAAEKPKEVERERDELKKRNADLELRLKQLQAAVDDQVHQALGETGTARTLTFPSSGAMSARQPVGPFISRFRPMFPPFNGMPDTVELAIAFSDALGEKETARPALEAAKQKVNSGHGATSFDVETASAQFAGAERKVRLLRNMITTSRDVAADEAERIRRLGAVRAVSTAEVRNAEARLKMLDDILASDPDAVAKSSKVPPPPEPK